MSKSKVLYVHVTAATSEVIKNLVLAGIQAAIFDPRPHPNPHTCSFFLATRTTKPPPAKKSRTVVTLAQAVQPAIEELNPLLGECPVIDSARTVEELVADVSTLTAYSVVVASHLTAAQAAAMADVVTAAGNKFFMLDTFGMEGAAVIDLGPNYTYRPEKGKELLDPVTLTKRYTVREILATPLHKAVNRFHKILPPVVWVRYRLVLEGKTNADDALAWCRATGVPDELLHKEACFQPHALDHLAKVAQCELAPVASVLGGLVGNEVIKVRIPNRSMQCLLG